MRIEKSTLTQAMNRVKGIIPRKTSIPSLQGLLVKDGKLIANNLEVMATVPLGIISDESFIIPDNMVGFINSLPNDTVDINVDETSITVKCKKVRNKTQSLDPGKFPMPNDSWGECFDLVLDSKALLDAIRRLFHLIPLESSQKSMTAMQIKGSSGTVSFVGLDGRRLGKDSYDCAGDFEILVPKNALIALQSLGPTGEIKIKHNGKLAMFSADGMELATRLVEGNYYDIGKLLNLEPSIRANVDRKELLEAVERARLAVRDETVPMRFSLANDEIEISAKASTSSYSDIVQADGIDSKALVIGFSMGLMAETLKTFECDIITLNFAGSKSPCIFEGDGNYKEVLLPVLLAGDGQ